MNDSAYIDNNRIQILDSVKGVKSLTVNPGGDIISGPIVTGDRFTIVVRRGSSQESRIYSLRSGQLISTFSAGSYNAPQHPQSKNVNLTHQSVKNDYHQLSSFQMPEIYQNPIIPGSPEDYAQFFNLLKGIALFVFILFSAAFFFWS